MVMGTAGELPKTPPKPVQFLEDLTEAEVMEALNIPPGLENLGNTCYMVRYKKKDASLYDIKNVMLIRMPLYNACEQCLNFNNH